MLQDAPQGLRILILDDSAERHQAFAMRLIGNVVEHVETAREAIYQLDRHGPWDVVFLDHDLAGTELVASGPGTGYEVAQWIAEHEDKRPKCVILHTYNPVGAKNMKALLPDASWMPGIWAK